MKFGTDPIFCYSENQGQITIHRCHSVQTQIEIPDTIQGKPVVALAPYAFSSHIEESDLIDKTWTSSPEKLPTLCGDRLEAVTMGNAMTQVGKYCFYNCSQLTSISFTNSLKDWESGCFTGCHNISHLRVQMYHNTRSSLREVLGELWEEICVDYVFENQRARLWFPECYEEGVENTPARILETHIHGSGQYYRNCFRNKQFDFEEYDSRFSYGAAWEPTKLLANLIYDRLRFPWGLTEQAKDHYQQYVKEHYEEMMLWVLEKREMAAVVWLSALDHTPEQLRFFRQKAVEKQYTEAVSYLMDLGYKKGIPGRKRKRLEL